MNWTFAIFVTIGAIGYGVSGALLAQVRTQRSGIYTADQAKRGQAAYADACASCHGADLTGDELAPALAGIEFSSAWNGKSVGDLFRQIQTSMPPTGPGTLPPAQVAEIVAYILSKNNAPTGQNELPSNPEELSQINITAEK